MAEVSDTKEKTVKIYKLFMSDIRKKSNIHLKAIATDKALIEKFITENSVEEYEETDKLNRKFIKKFKKDEPLEWFDFVDTTHGIFEEDMPETAFDNFKKEYPKLYLTT